MNWLLNIKLCVVLQALILVASGLLHSDENSTMGREYLLSLPFIESGEITFYVISLSKDVFSVLLTTPWNASPLKVSLEVRPQKVTTYVVEKIYYNKYVALSYWSYKITANKDFAFFVLMMNGGLSADTLTVIPVKSWGYRYFAVTLSKKPSINIVAKMLTTVSIMLRLVGGDLVLGTGTYKNGQIVKTTLNADEAYTFQACQEMAKSGTWTGTSIVGSAHIGVITGSCSASTQPMLCDGEIGSFTPSEDIVVEMIPPVEMYGSEFVLISSTGLTAPFKAIVVSATDNTTVEYCTAMHNKTYFIATAGDYVTIDLSKNPSMLKSDIGVQVVLVQQSACLKTNLEKDIGDPSLSVLVPTVLFLQRYVVSTPEIPSAIHSQHYVALVINTGQETEMRVNSYILVPLGDVWFDVGGSSLWKFGIYTARSNVFELYSVTDQPFGCYVFGLAKEWSYMHPAGYLTYHISYTCTKSPTTAGDGIDNDCDEEIDEEMSNNKDDDNDGLIDEDLVKDVRVDGMWSSWKSWVCPVLCGNGTYYTRQRFCNNPAPQNGGRQCDGSKNEMKEEFCKGPNLTCPKDCGVGLYGLNCSGNCQNCDPDCEKLNGTCTYCKVGYAAPEESCIKACPPLTYGFRCRGSCVEKCGGECLEKVYGYCVDSYESLYFLVLLAIPAAFFILLLILKKRRQTALNNSLLQRKRLSSMKEQSRNFLLAKRSDASGMDATTVTTSATSTYLTSSDDSSTTTVDPSPHFSFKDISPNNERIRKMKEDNSKVKTRKSEVSLKKLLGI